MSDLFVRMPPLLTYIAPLGLAILKAINPEFKCLDLVPEYNSQYTNYKKMANYILSYEPKIVGFTVETVNLNASLKVSNILHRKGIKIIWGGCETQFTYKTLSRYKFIDHIVVGEAESIDIKNIKKKVVFPPKIFDLNKSPIPNYDDFDMSLYDMVGIETQRGCVNRCAFCNVRFFPYSEIYREKSVKKVKEEIHKLKKYKKGFLFCDNITNPYKKRLIELCKEIESEKILWHSQFFPKIDKEETKWLKKSGCFMVSLGIESFSNNVLKRMEKKVTTEDIIKTIKNLKEEGIKVHGMFFFGFPTENIIDIFKTIMRILKYKKYFDTVGFGYYILSQNSLVHKNPEKYGIKLLKQTEDQILIDFVPYKRGWSLF